MADEGSRGSWWHTLPGVLTAVAGVLSAVTGLVVALRDPPEQPPPGASGAAPPAAPGPAPMPASPAAPAPGVVATPAPTPAPVTREPPAGPATATEPPALVGIWRDQHGTISQIEQSGERFRIVGRGMNCAGAWVQGHGEGVVRGGRFETRFQTTTPSTARCVGQLSADGRTSTAHCVDSVCGEYISIGQRQ